jgi:N-acyl homoserine lactone hydrolase
MVADGARPSRLYLIQLGTVRVTVSGGTMDMSHGCYLVQMSDGENILVDSGEPPEGMPEMPVQVLERTQGRNVIEQLSELGLRPEDIGVLVCTHLDVDHAGRNDAFPNAELVVQRAHLEHARSGNPRFEAARAHWDRPGLRYRQVDGDTELRPGLTLVETSGHTRGHQSVLVRLPRTGPVLLAIDAVPVEAFFTPERQAMPADEDGDQALASTRKLLDLAERERAELVVFHHDGRQWRGLKKAPEHYD